ncbi:MAG TPA: hypothetical protein VFY39_04230, partial [Gammaproteobacteria bacterium]|nr:hypothetical protein [Gammaproteobacteria bacterium]
MLADAFLFEVLFLLDAPPALTAFVCAVPVAFFGAAFTAGRLAAFLRPAVAERLTVVFRESALAVLLLPPVFFFFLAAACLAGICLASKRDYTKRAIIQMGSGSGSLSSRLIDTLEGGRQGTRRRRPARPAVLGAD